MKNIIYRDLKKEDLKEITMLIKDAFKFHEFIHNKELLDIISTIYLEEALYKSSFVKVASKDNKVLGIILCSANNSLTNYHHLLSLKKEKDFSTLPIKDKRDKNELTEFIKVKDIYDELINGKESLFDGSIELFIVSKEARGLGIGKTLLRLALKYMKSMDVSSIYLFTDTRCNYGFYDSQGFNCLNEKSLYIKTIDSTLQTFLYEYIL